MRPRLGTAEIAGPLNVHVRDLSFDDARALEIGRAVLALAELLVPRDAGPGDLVPIDEAARIAATSKRTLSEAIRNGELDAFGKQRDRSVRRDALEDWIESRRFRPPVVGPNDADIERRMRRIEGRHAKMERERAGVVVGAAQQARVERALRSGRRSAP